MRKSKRLFDQTTHILEERQKEYGSVVPLAHDLAQRWSITLGHTVTPEQAMLCMVDLKLARLKANPKHLDSLIDTLGYLACFAELTL